MTRDVILLGEVAAKGATMIDIRAGGASGRRLSVKRLHAEYGADASLRDIMQAQIGECPNRDSAQWYTRCDPFCPTLAQLFGVPESG